jgi:TetR/AcrR family fatty acid metabolism transcriptional regulator
LNYFRDGKLEDDRMQTTSKNDMNRADNKPLPPGRVKITRALKALLEKKEFGLITTAEIAKTAGVAEALIYKYFNDKRDLLHQVLKEYLEQHQAQLELDLKGITGALNKLRKLIWSHVNVYATRRVFARIFLIEVRNHPDYYKSETNKLAKTYSNTALRIIEEGIRNGEIRDNLQPKLIWHGILGSIEQVCLSAVIFGRDLSPDDLTEKICEFVFKGIENKPT